MATENTEFPDLSEIQELSDIGDVDCLLEDHNICWDMLDMLDTVEEMKERLVLEHRRLHSESYMAEVSRAIVEAGEDDQKKRAQLIGFLEEMKKVTLKDADANGAKKLEEFLKTEDTSASIQGDCEQRVEHLPHGECILLVTGETAAGKASVLNLLFGERIFPVHAGSWIETITTVRYGQRVARILYNDPDVPTEEIQLDEEGLNRIHAPVFLKGTEREVGHDIKEVQLYMPLLYLRNGLVLAYYPYIGETEFLEKYLVDYISRNQIHGFIYVIKSDAQCGVIEDRLLLLLKIIIEQQRKSGHFLPFDPKASMFICNKIDAINDESEREKTKLHIMEQLEKFWPEFDPSSVVLFSAKCAQRDVDAHPDYINVQYRNLLDGLQKLVTITIDRRIKASYKWIGKLLQRITHFLKSTVRRLDMSERDRKEKTEKVNFQIRNLTSKSTTVVQTLKAEIEERKNELVKEIRVYLQKPQAKYMLCSAWKSGEIPEVKEDISDMIHWGWVKERIDLAFYDRLFRLLHTWEDENCNIPKIEEMVVQDIKVKLGLLEEEICEMEQDLESESDSISDEDFSASTTTLSRRLSRRLTLSYTAGGALIDAPTQLPLQLLARMKKEKPTSILTDNVFTREKERRNTNSFNKDPQKWAKERVEKLLKKLSQNKPGKSKGKDGVLEELIMQLLQRPLAFVEMVEEKVPSILDANTQLLQSFEEACLTDKKDLARYETMMKDIENLRKGLKNYGEGYIFVDDFKSNEVKVLQVLKTGQSLARTFTRNIRDLITTGSEEDTKNRDLTLRGLWSVLSGGVLKQGDNAQPIAIRFYLPSSGVENTFEEVAKLRCLVHNDIPLAEFLGIHHTELQLPAFIYSGSLQSVRRFMISSSNPERFVQSILLETSEAISYIHSKRLVHMEVSSSTVTVDENGSVKLTGACLPRRASLPLDVEIPVSDFVYLAPEVLNGGLYITPSDVYGFGLLMYELITKSTPFQKQKKFALQSFAKSLSPVDMLFEDMDIESTVSSRTFNIMKRCVGFRESDRLHMTEVTTSLTDIKSQFRRSSIQWGSSEKSVPPSALFKKSLRSARECH